ncbi:hypothetical protein BJ138DRAFT_735342 [Hygrophoropsis aurantiaca]|uniref:Uncharacterized protein n=1 Tax=Hygrophoropsis aurantiaca TaxID=72124 RepID=A0ACB7ZY25_9AGAM|nr:hypothetical protein BJ138DRAFT_735342 [Hygrophoropsis aurantiaca]
MPRASKRLKPAEQSESRAQPEASSSTSDNLTSQTQAVTTASSHMVATLLFEVGPTLDRIPDDMLFEIISYFPDITQEHVLFGHYREPPAIPLATRERINVLRKLSQTNQLLRTRCFPLAWTRFEVCAADAQTATFFRILGEAMKRQTAWFANAPHLLPLVRNVTVGLTRYQAADIIPAFARCLSSMPNVQTIEVVHAHSQMTTALKNAFEGRRFPSVRTAIVPSCAHEILRCCPLVEEVTCNEDTGSTVIGAIIKGNCTRVRSLLGTNAPLKRLVKFLPNLRAISVKEDMDVIQSLSQFPNLEVIEVNFNQSSGHRPPPSETEPLAGQVEKTVEAARAVLKGNKSTAEKLVRLRLVKRFVESVYTSADGVPARVTLEVIKV